jgi:hypothetical protein
LLREVDCFDQLSVIPINKEAVLGIRLCDHSKKKMKARINIMDSMSFLSGSLDSLSKRLVDDGVELNLVKDDILCKDDNNQFSQQKYDLLTRKGWL